MGIQVAVNHRTTYEYDRPVALSPHVVRLRPAPHCRTAVSSYSLRIDPPDHFLNWQQDPHGNHVARAVFRNPARRLRIEVDLIAEMTASNPFDFFLDASAETFPFGYEPRLARDLHPFLETEAPGPELRRFLAAVDRRPRRTVDFLVALNRRTERRIDYVTRPEPGIQACDDTLARGRGSCRDSAWLLIQTLRQLGLAARFVSGYLIQLAPDAEPPDGPAGPPRDSGDLHAWTEVYLPGAGWVGLDPTSGMFAGEGHLPVAAVAEPAAAAPVSGSVTPAAVRFDHAMTVTRLRRAPRGARSGPEAAWAAVDRLGRAIDRHLADEDVRLTMAGRPAFASLDPPAREEAAAAGSAAAVVVEKRPPPADPRSPGLKAPVAPGLAPADARPARTWDELVAATTTVYEAARAAGMAAEKFMRDGRRREVGGHPVVLGGPGAADSPFLRRPHLLPGLVACWVNHPSLSYLFSGPLVGPAGRAPRVDETRADSVAELEIAFDQIDGRGPDCPPRLVHGVLRHLLADAGGDTRRTEFCIDRLHPPGTASERQGLVELRGFETLPRPRMTLARDLLLRGLVAWFWTEPYRRPLVHWGSRLHDEFMLPHYVRRDFETVVGDLRGAGFPFETEWFDAHFEFRYPHVGRAAWTDVELDLRTAAEPRQALDGQPCEGAADNGGEASVERLQVLVRGAVEGRHVVTCNRRRVPLHPTGTAGEQVAGVRYRARRPASLHPAVEVHTPLTFDVVDTWSGRSIGGCVYHASHPGGLAWDTPPVNAAEAEARRAARFVPFGHTPGPLEPGPPEADPAAPHTLDLRRPSPAGPRP